MKFITHRRFHGKGLEREENIPRLTVLEACDGAPHGFAGDLLCLDGRAVCAPFSQVGVQHFAVNDDGMGMERGALTWAIAWAPRKTSREGARFSEAEADMLAGEYGHWLVDGGDGFINFTNSFYTAPVPELEELAAMLNIRWR